MHHKGLTPIRINFWRNIELIEQKYEVKIKKLYSDDQLKLNTLILKKNINIQNFNFYKMIEFKFYEKAIICYFNKIKLIEDNDNTNIILLYFPEYLKSANLHKEIDLNDDKFNIQKFTIKDPTKKHLEKEIKMFFENYNKLNKKYGFIFNRKEIFNYMELFLNQYNYDDYDKITEKEKNELVCLHYFSCLIRPENFL